MKKVRCPSCGKETKADTDTCEYCGKPVFENRGPTVEPISPYDDLFSDDIVPEPKQVKPPIKGPVLPSDFDLTEPEKSDKWKIPLPARRDMTFLAGIAIIGIILIMVLLFIPSVPVSESKEKITELTPTPEPTITTAPKQTPQKTTKTNATGYSLFDNFSDKESGWGDYDSDTFLRYYSQGEYHLIQKGEDLSDGALLGKDVENFVTEVEARLDSGPLTGQYGLLFRFADDNYYSFGIDGRGWYTVQKHVDGKVYDLIPLTETYILNKGYDSNVLGVKAEGNTLSMYINGKMVRAISDTSLTHGDIGFFAARLSEEGFIKEQPVHVAFDNFKFGELPS